MCEKNTEVQLISINQIQKEYEKSRPRRKTFEKKSLAEKFTKLHTI